ncbi:MAG: S-layer homology domain-containing protein, partial [Nodosilinea sp.]
PNLNRPEDLSSSGNRILDFDELLAIVLAFLGVGFILWWGIGRSKDTLTRAELQRRAGDLALVAPTEVEPERLDEIERRQTVNERSGPIIAESDSVENTGGFRGFGTGPEPPEETVRREAVPVPVPAPATTPAEAAEESVPEDQPVDISDVPPNHWAYPFIKPLFDEGYLSRLPGGGFRPDEPMTRAEMAALLSEAFGDNQDSTSPPFTDVSDTYWAAPAINSAVTQGFMTGYPEGDFRPDRTIPRYEVLVALVSGLKLPPSSNPEASLQPYTDLSELPDWATPKVAIASENEIIVNYPDPDRVKPSQAATRAEIAAMIHQALVQQGKLPAVESEYTVP